MPSVTMPAKTPGERMPKPTPVESGVTDRSYDCTLFSSSLVRVGRFRCPAGHPDLDAPSATQSYCFAFPRTPAWIEHESSVPYIADPNVIPVHNPGCWFRRRPIRPEGHRSDWFAVDAALLRDMVAPREPAAAHSSMLFRFNAVRCEARTYLAQRQVFRHVHADGQVDALFVEHSVLDILDEVLDAAYGPIRADAGTRRGRSLADDAREHLNRTYRTGQGLSALAEAVGSSVFHLCRVFRQQTGWTIHHYRNQLRLRRALELVETGGDILDVAIYLGFSGHSHLTRTFHRTFGMTPSQFRAASASRRAACHARTAMPPAARQGWPRRMVG
jgi:AraC-like DNA-binding protein